MLLTLLDLLGTAVFALSGAVVAIERRLDLFGALVLAFVTASFGGIIRDLLLGATPPDAIRTWHALAVATGAGAAALYLLPTSLTGRRSFQMLDAAGLSLFAVTGTGKALAAGLDPVMAALLGMISGIGGGMVRDVLTARVPIVLRAELYAVAALAGAALVVGGHLLGLAPETGALAGAALCFGLRLGSILWGWHLPVAARPDPA